MFLIFSGLNSNTIFDYRTGFLMGAVSGAVVGGLVASVYASGNFPMPTWAPVSVILVKLTISKWALIQFICAILFNYSQILFVTM